ncbi:hypothetical protein ABZ341_29565 [Streptomyces sp. NPDC006173]|uniref:hypothetical protein n=1 Tax=Streptomyces sp. NPDC006173 TaxID=3155349 RepID=UPI0033EDAC9B
MRQALTDSSADLLWRAPANRVLPANRFLRDASWLSNIHATTDPAKRDPVQVRVLTCHLKGTGKDAAVLS